MTSEELVKSMYPKATLMHRSDDGWGSWVVCLRNRWLFPAYGPSVPAGVGYRKCYQEYAWDVIADQLSTSSRKEERP